MVAILYSVNFLVKTHHKLSSSEAVVSTCKNKFTRIIQERHNTTIKSHGPRFFTRRFCRYVCWVVSVVVLCDFHVYFVWICFYMCWQRLHYVTSYGEFWKKIIIENPSPKIQCHLEIQGNLEIVLLCRHQVYTHTSFPSSSASSSFLMTLASATMS
jgi:hypothetical protein